VQVDRAGGTVWTAFFVELFSLPVKGVHGSLTWDWRVWQIKWV